MKRFRVFSLLAASSAIGAAALLAQDDVGIPIGSTPPAVEIEALDGSLVNLAEYVGKRPVLVEFWATWCPQCERLFPRMIAAHRQYGSQVDFVVVAVAVNQSQRSIQRHLERHPMPFRVLWDTQGRAVRAFQAPTTSYVVMLDAQGKVTYTGTGADQDIEAAVRSGLGR